MKDINKWSLVSDNVMCVAALKKLFTIAPRFMFLQQWLSSGV